MGYAIKKKEGYANKVWDSDCYSQGPVMCANFFIYKKAKRNIYSESVSQK